MTAPGRGAGSVRIVSGQWRRSVISVVAGDGLRPTAERVRETVYDWLGHLFGSCDGLRVLDMFAGSGAMGFEAASRGASAVDWVDTNRSSIVGIRATLQRLKAGDSMQAHLGDAFAFLKKARAEYDLIIIDPPFSRDLQAKALGAALDCLRPEGLIYVESPEALLPQECLDRLALIRVRAGSAGMVRFELLARAGSGMAALAKPLKEKKKGAK